MKKKSLFFTVLLLTVLCFSINNTFANLDTRGVSTVIEHCNDWES